MCWISLCWQFGCEWKWNQLNKEDTTCQCVWFCNRTSLCSCEGILAAAGHAEVELLAGCCLLFHLCMLILLRVSQSHNVWLIAGGQQRHMLCLWSVVSSLNKICYQDVWYREKKQSGSGLFKDQFPAERKVPCRLLCLLTSETYSVSSMVSSCSVSSSEARFSSTHPAAK